MENEEIYNKSIVEALKNIKSTYEEIVDLLLKLPVPEYMLTILYVTSGLIYADSHSLDEFKIRMKAYIKLLEFHCDNTSGDHFKKKNNDE